MEQAIEGQAANSRRSDIDWLRVMAVLLLVPFHTALFFVPYGDSYLKGMYAPGFEYFVDFVGQWHMPLLFLISGIGVWHALRFRTGKAFALERAKRLLVPLVFSMIALIPVVVYCERLYQEAFEGSFLRFLPHAYWGIYPEGNLSWGHMWFVAYLFVFSMLSLPLFQYLKEGKGRNLVSQLGDFCERPGAIYLFAVPLAIIEATLRAGWPGFQNLVDDWANFFFYLTFLVYGYLLCSDDTLWRAVDRHRNHSLILATLTILLMLALDVFGLSPALGYTPGFMLLMVLDALSTWFWVLAILGFGRKYLCFDNAILKYANEAVLPFYMLHHVFVVVIGRYVLGWNTGATLQFLFITATSLIGILLFYDLVVRRTRVKRFLFGMKPEKPCETLVGAASGVPARQ
jgi:surface polysaccharide O-acyltransferase-like enzyme